MNFGCPFYPEQHLCPDFVPTDAPTENKRSAGDSIESPKPQAASADRNPVMSNRGLGTDGGVLDE